MQKRMWVAISLLLVGSLANQGQQGQSAVSSDSSSATGGGVMSGQVAGPAYSKPEKPVGSFTENYVYVYEPGQYGANRSAMGWSVMPSLTPVHGFGLQADFESLYVRSIYPGVSQVIMAAGPRYTMAPRSRFTPFIFGEAGEMRIETQRRRNVDWEPVAKAGFGFQSRLTQHFGVTLVPGEWLGERYDYNGSWNQNFTSRVGITFYLDKGRSPVS